MPGSARRDQLMDPASVYLEQRVELPRNPHLKISKFLSRNLVLLIGSKKKAHFMQKSLELLPTYEMKSLQKRYMSKNSLPFKISEPFGSVHMIC